MPGGVPEHMIKLNNKAPEQMLCGVLEQITELNHIVQNKCSVSLWKNTKLNHNVPTNALWDVCEQIKIEL